MSLTFSPANSSDLSTIYTIQKRAFEGLYLKYRDDKTSPYKESFESLEQKFNKIENHFFLIFEELTLIGFLKIAVNAEKSIMRISPIAILPTYVNQGYGKQAMSIAEGLFTVEKSILSTIYQERKLVNFYHSCGYTSTGLKPSETPGLTFIFFEKQLKSC